MNNEYIIRMKDMLKEEYDAYASAISLPPRRGFRVNTLKCTDDELFSFMDIDHEKSPFAKHGYYTQAKAGIGYTPASLAGLFYLQEPSASSAVTILDPQPNTNVLDLCAAPGSKSTQILEMLGGTGFLVSNEINAKRCQILAENIERNGAPNALVLNADTKQVADAFPNFFDSVLCDAPCSGEGMFRKSDDAINDWSLANVEKCAALQKEILENAYQCLKPSGTLVYSTCTFSLEENEQNMIWFLQQHPDMVIEQPNVNFGRKGFPIGESTDKAIRIFPMDGGEGHFICRMHKQGSASTTSLPLMKSTPIAKDVLQQINAIVKPYPYMIQKGTRIYGGTVPFYDCGHCHILRDQVFLGEVLKNNRFEPRHHLAMSIASKFAITVDLEDDMLRNYMHGEQLPIACDKGYCLLTWHHKAIGLGKSDGKCIKNKYPKSMRSR